MPTTYLKIHPTAPATSRAPTLFLLPVKAPGPLDPLYVPPREPPVVRPPEQVFQFGTLGSVAVKDLDIRDDFQWSINNLNSMLLIRCTKCFTMCPAWIYRTETDVPTKPLALELLKAHIAEKHPEYNPVVATDFYIVEREARDEVLEELEELARKELALLPEDQWTPAVGLVTTTAPKTINEGTPNERTTFEIVGNIKDREALEAFQKSSAANIARQGSGDSEIVSVYRDPQTSKHQIERHRFHGNKPMTYVKSSIGHQADLPYRAAPFRRSSSSPELSGPGPTTTTCSRFAPYVTSRAAPTFSVSGLPTSVDPFSYESRRPFASSAAPPADPYLIVSTQLQQRR